MGRMSLFMRFRINGGVIAQFKTHAILFHRKGLKTYETGSTPPAKR